MLKTELSVQIEQSDSFVHFIQNFDHRLTRCSSELNKVFRERELETTSNGCLKVDSSWAAYDPAGLTCIRSLP